MFLLDLGCNIQVGSIDLGYPTILLRQEPGGTSSSGPPATKSRSTQPCSQPKWSPCNWNVKFYFNPKNQAEISIELSPIRTGKREARSLKERGMELEEMEREKRPAPTEVQEAPTSKL